MRTKIQVFPRLLSVIQQFMRGRSQSIQRGVSVSGMNQRLNWLGEQRILPQLIGSMTNMFEVRQIGKTPAPAERGMGKIFHPALLLWRG